MFHVKINKIKGGNMFVSCYIKFKINKIIVCFIYKALKDIWVGFIKWQKKGKSPG